MEQHVLDIRSPKNWEFRAQLKPKPHHSLNNIKLYISVPSTWHTDLCACEIKLASLPQLYVGRALIWLTWSLV